MEEVEKKSKYTELTELIGKIDIEMQRSRDRQVKIDEMRQVLYDEIMSPMKYQEKTEEMESAKKDKSDFDERNKNALIEAKKEILQLKQDKGKEYQEKMYEAAMEKKNIDKKLLSMKQKGLPAEKLLKAEEFATQAKVKVDKEIKEIQQSYSDLITELEGYENKIRGYAVELGVENEIDSVTLEEKKEEQTIPEQSEAVKNDTSEVVQETSKEPQPGLETTEEIKNPNIEETRDLDSKEEEEAKPKTKIKVKPRMVVVKKTNSDNTRSTRKSNPNKENVIKKVIVENESVIGDEETSGSTVIEISTEEPKRKSREDITDARLQKIDTLVSELQSEGITSDDNVTDQRKAEIDEIVESVQAESLGKTRNTEGIDNTDNFDIGGQEETGIKGEPEEEWIDISSIDKEDGETIQDIEILSGAYTGPIGITFDAKKQYYEIEIKGRTKTISLESILSDKGYQNFFEKFSEKLSHIKGLDPYISYIISTSGVENSDKILDEYFEVMGDKTSNERKLNSLNIEYNMDGIYGRKYSPEISSQIMSCANAHKEKQLATVNKGRFTRFLEKYDEIRMIWEKVSKIGAKQQLALPEGKVVSDNAAKKFRQGLHDDKELPENANIILTRIATCQSIEQLDDMLQQAKAMSLLSEKDKKSIELAVSNRKTRLENDTRGDKTNIEIDDKPGDEIGNE